MPTILINTNLKPSTNCGLGDEQNRQAESVDAELRQEINAIINKLLIKSETVNILFNLFIFFCCLQVFVGFFLLFH